MKAFTLALPLALASLSLAQLQGLPTCAQGCANIFLNGGIGNCGRDAECICADKSFISAISCCLIDACNADDQQKAIDFAQQICQAQKVSVPNTVSCASTSTSGGAQSTSTTPASNSAGTVTTTSATTSTGSSTTSASTTTSTGTAATQSSSTSRSASGNVGPRQTAAPVLGALGGILAAAALL